MNSRHIFVSPGTSSSATIPTIGDAIEALHNFSEDLAKVLQLMSDLSGEIASQNQLRVDNMSEASPQSRFNLKVNDLQECFQLLDLPELPQDLDVGQKRAIICRELERRRKDARNVAQTLLRMCFAMSTRVAVKPF